MARARHFSSSPKRSDRPWSKHILLCNWFSKFYVHGSVHHAYMSITVQQDATTYSLFIPINRSTCFVWYLHPSSGSHITVPIASGISVAGNVTCRESGTSQPRSRQVTVTVTLMPEAVDTVIWAPGDGWRYHPKHERFRDINKLYIVDTTHSPTNALLY
jgi:hypothetical protein